MLKDQIFQMTPNLPLNKLEQFKERIIDVCKTYEEPEIDKDGNLINKKLKKKKLDESMHGKDLDEVDISIMED